MNKLFKRLGLCVLTACLMAPITLTAAGCESDAKDDDPVFEIGE
jgi:hypothetical protein